MCVHPDRDMLRESLSQVFFARSFMPMCQVLNSALNSFLKKTQFGCMNKSSHIHHGFSPPLYVKLHDTGSYRDNTYVVTLPGISAGRYW